MRASTLFVITLALLVGLGVAVAGKLAGWFSPPPAPVAEQPPDVKVLVAAQNIFAGDLIDPKWVGTRSLSPAELEQYKKDPKRFLPPTPGAASLRIAKRNLLANEPILHDDLEEMAKPEPLHQRLLPSMRAVNVSVEKDRCVGGLIQVGEWVDVHLTSTIEAAGVAEATTRTAPVATGVRVIAKRNALWKIFAALPEDKPVEYTLEMNPYRAAVVEFSKNKGYLSLVPVSAAEQVELEKHRDRLLQVKHAGGDPSLLQVSYQDAEDQSRIQMITQGDLTVGHDDLIRIFNLTSPPPPLANVEIDQFVGAKYKGAGVFTPEGHFADAPGAKSSATKPAANAGFTFSVPGCGPAECKTCQKK